MLTSKYIHVSCIKYIQRNVPNTKIYTYRSQKYIHNIHHRNILYTNDTKKYIHTVQTSHKLNETRVCHACPRKLYSLIRVNACLLHIYTRVHTRAPLSYITRNNMIFNNTHLFTKLIPL